MIVDKIRRYVWLLDTIYRAGERGITFDEINEKWQRYDLLSEGRAYPKRTFEQHKEEIQETFNISFTSSAHKGGTIPLLKYVDFNKMLTKILQNLRLWLLVLLVIF